MSITDPIYQAISDGNCHQIDVLLAGHDVNIKSDWDKWNLLHIALNKLVEVPSPDLIRHLIKLRVDVNAKDRCGWTPLHFAARLKCPASDQPKLIECIKLLIDAGADVDAKDNDGVTSLHRSVFTYPWNLGMIELLLAAGAKPTSMFSMFLNAVASPDKDRVVDLLKKYHRHDSRF